MLSRIFSFVFSLYTRTYARAENDISKEVSPVVSSRGLHWETVAVCSPAVFSGRLSSDNRKTRENSFLFSVKRVSKFKSSFHLI